MDALRASGPSIEAIQADLHRGELLRGAAASRLARLAQGTDTRATRASEAGLVSRIRAVFGLIGQSAQPDCVEGA